MSRIEILKTSDSPDRLVDKLYASKRHVLDG